MATTIKGLDKLRERTFLCILHHIQNSSNVVVRPERNQGKCQFLLIPESLMCVVGKNPLLIQYILYSSLLLLVDLLLIADFSGCCPVRVGVSHVRYTVIDTQRSQGWGTGAVLTANSESSESAYCWTPGLADMQSTVPVKVIGLQFYFYSLSPNRRVQSCLFQRQFLIEMPTPSITRKYCGELLESPR